MSSWARPEPEGEERVGCRRRRGTSWTPASSAGSRSPATATSSCTEVTFHSAPRSAGGNRSNWMRRWRGRRPAPRRWLRERRLPRTWIRRRGRQRLGPARSSPANRERKALTTRAGVLCLSAAKNRRSDPLLPVIDHLQLLTYMGLCFLFKPLCAFGGVVARQCRLTISLMMYRVMEAEERAPVFRTAAFQISMLLCSCMGFLV